MNLKSIFFGTPDIGVYVLEELEKGGIIPSLIVTNPDAPQGRKMIVTETPVARFARDRGIPCLKPETLKDEQVFETFRTLQPDISIVAAYGKIIPKSILEIPHYGTLNMHPSLLPKLRGASPIRSALLTNEYPTGVSIMKLTEGLDEGPLLAQETAELPHTKWPMRGHELDELLARMGGKLLVRILPEWMKGTLSLQEQNHINATYCAKITKDMALIDLTAVPKENLRKICAFDGWPGAYYFHEKTDGTNIRVKIIDAEIRDNQLILTRVIPEGKKEMPYEDFIRGLH